VYYFGALSLQAMLRDDPVVITKKEMISLPPGRILPPPPSPDRPAPKKPPKLALPNPKSGKVTSDQPEVKEPPQPIEIEKVHLPGDMSLYFDDPDRCLDKVLVGYQGLLGFAPVSDDQYITNKFEPAGWRRVPMEIKESRAAYEPVLQVLYKYEFIDRLRRGYNLPEKEYIAYGLFPVEFDVRVMLAVRKAAASAGIEHPAPPTIVLNCQPGFEVRLNSTH
jgi:hypothetical protein